MTRPISLSPYGVWRVTTEGDIEGRSTKDLGIHEGYIDDIAFMLAGSACYGLQFEPIDTRVLARSQRALTEVHISLRVENAPWDANKSALIDYFRCLLSGRDVTVTNSNYCASVRLIAGSTPARQAQARHNAIKNTALAKLTPEEVQALGLTHGGR